MTKLIVVLMFATTATIPDLAGLDELRWQNRVIVLNDMDYPEELLKLLESKKEAIEERDIVWFVLAKNQTNSNFKGPIKTAFAKQLRERYQLRSGQVVLIGKDGGLKSSFDGIDLNAIFAEIDAMPMRQREMQQ